MDGSSIAPDVPEGTGEGGYPSLALFSPDLNTVATKEGVLRYVSPACYDLFGWKPDELEGRTEDEFIHPDDLAALRDCREALESAEVATVSYRFICQDGSSRWTEATSRRVDENGELLVVSAIRDVTNRQMHIARLEHQAFSDPLTGVANRTVLLDRLRHGLRRLGRSSGVLAVLYLDLDRFKVVNDSLGLRVGDSVLLQMAERLVQHLRPADTLGRLGGDEFVIVADALVDEQSAIGMAKRIAAAGRQPFHVGGEDLVCTMSIGVACTKDSERSADDLLGEADLALHRAKERGRDRVEAFDEQLRTKAVGRLVTERMLRRALEEQRLVVEYQPIVDLRSRRLVGAEALMRIMDPDRGLLLPDSFIGVAEETGLLIEMDEEVLNDAVRQASRWHSRMPGSDFTEVAINVTARHLADSGFHRGVIDQLDAHEVPHGNLQVEVTERVLLEASNSSMTGLWALREAGVKIGLDDFGTGYSSLAYLHQFPLDFVKIDKSFIHGLNWVNGAGRSGRAIVAAIIDLSHALELTVVAEGVETEEQLRILEALDCDRGQGFLFSPSAPPALLDGLVTAGLQHDGAVLTSGAAAS